ncbi:hypothetical protein [Dermatophilus congolensis]|uniref:Uncharacterized protein n=1 Tax=Dermatophilus congolensis TaxID=1863 RepID=A0A239VL21_9MICO|nr:hypothetical protein [Dermatophilus congolensis]MBO3129276.1 hypothetical protein [Dermatophilus congolensis]MBO3132092.1 hypothetical protein [Dermatophilus congolensis]MBO3133752.1 hypothetical protein [Dermatophilus congolensis]MBO3135983.1 hypothetical protein [Dermatophilus congolensis]MBO3138225.1 hypothetical protein [Dermatophilus congolensis]
MTSPAQRPGTDNGPHEDAANPASGAAVGCGGCSRSTGGGCGSGSAAAATGQSPSCTPPPTAPAGCSAASAAKPALKGTDKAAAVLVKVPAWIWAATVSLLVASGLVIAGSTGLVLFSTGFALFALLGIVSWKYLSVPGRAVRVAVAVFALGIALIRFMPI